MKNIRVPVAYQRSPFAIQNAPWIALLSISQRQHANRSWHSEHMLSGSADAHSRNRMIASSTAAE